MVMWVGVAKLHYFMLQRTGVDVQRRSSSTVDTGREEV